MWWAHRWVESDVALRPPARRWRLVALVAAGVAAAGIGVLAARAVSDDLPARSSRPAAAITPAVRSAARRTAGVGTTGGPAGFAISTVDPSTSNVGRFNSVTIGGDGLGIVSYRDLTTGAVKVAHCRNVACTSDTRSQIDTSGSAPARDPSHQTAIAIGADGLALVAYHDIANGNLKVAHCRNVACTAATTSTIDASANDVGGFASLAVGEDGKGIVSYYDATDGDLEVSRCADTACSSAESVTIDRGGDVGQYTSLTIGADGNVLVAYRDVTNLDLKVARCADTGCSRASVARVDGVAAVGEFASIAIGSDGLGFISYHDDTEDNLKVAHCSDPGCSAATITVVDAHGSTGVHGSVAIGSDGLPVVAYHDYARSTLSVAHCSTIDCRKHTIAEVTRAVVDLLDLSMTVGSDGYPLISFWGDVDEDLRVVHCADVRCTPRVT